MRPAATLVELLVVLVILGVVLAVAAPSLRPAEARKSDWRSRVIEARKLAVTKGAPVTGYEDSLGRYTATPFGTIVADSAAQGSGAYAR